MSYAPKHRFAATVDPARLTEELDLIALSIGEESSRYRSLTELADANQVARQLADQRSFRPNLDAQTQGAYMMNRFSNDICGLICWLDLNGFCLGELWSDRAGVLDTWETLLNVGEESQRVRYRWWLPELRPVTAPPAPESLGFHLVERVAPLVDEIRRQTRLGKAALWRLLTDALAASYLNTGKGLGLTEQATARATAIIEATGKPLTNRQWHFRTYSVNAAQSPTHQRLSDRFRIRGGCCREYTLPGVDYCGTCVHLQEPERKARFQQHLRTVAGSADNA